MADVGKQRAQMAEIGVTGLRVQHGHVLDEQMRQLKGDRAVTTYEEMRLNEPIIHAALLSYELWIREAGWRVEPADDSAKAEEQAEFVDGCKDDMSLTFQDFVTEALSFLQYGWNLQEIVYKRRQGPDGKHPSAFDDGRIGWRKFAPRAQVTRDRWIFDDDGGLEAFIQRDDRFQEHVIPVEKFLLFRANKRKGSPEPHPPLRSAVIPWFHRKRFRTIEAIGIERDLAGFPVLYAPPDILADDTRRAEYQDIVRNIKRDEQEGVLLPTAYDEHGNQLVKLELLSTGGRRQFDLSAVQARLALEIMLSLIADILLIGHEKVGSFALADTKMALVETAGETWLAEIADVLNHHAVPRLLKLNGLDTRLAPKFVPGELRSRDLAERATTLLHAANAGFLTPDDETENVIRDELGLPERDLSALPSTNGHGEDMAKRLGEMMAGQHITKRFLRDAEGRLTGIVEE